MVLENIFFVKVGLIRDVNLGMATQNPGHQGRPTSAISNDEDWVGWHCHGSSVEGYIRLEPNTCTETFALLLRDSRGIATVLFLSMGKTVT